MTKNKMKYKTWDRITFYTCCNANRKQLRWIIEFKENIWMVVIAEWIEYWLRYLVDIKIMIDKIIWKNEVLDWCIYQQWDHFTTYTSYSKGLNWTMAPVEKSWKLKEVQEKAIKSVELQKKWIEEKSYIDLELTQNILKAKIEYKDFLINYKL